MNNQLRIFKNEQLGEIRALQNSGQPWFCLVDICRILDIKNISDCKDRLNNDGVVTNEVIDSLGRRQRANFINESNLYKVIFQSRKPEAEKFTEWVTSEVLPSIRKHGAYMTEETIEKALTSPDFLIQLASRLKEEQEKNMLLQNEKKILEPKAKYTDDVLNAEGLFTSTEIAKDFGLKSAQGLNKILNGFRVIRKVNGKWCLYADYCGKGYSKDKVTVIKKKDGTNKTVSEMYWTEKGRKFIYDFLKRQNLILNDIAENN